MHDVYGSPAELCCCSRRVGTPTSPVKSLAGDHSRTSSAEARVTHGWDFGDPIVMSRNGEAKRSMQHNAGLAVAVDVGTERASARTKGNRLFRTGANSRRGVSLASDAIGVDHRRAPAPWA